MHFNTHQMHKAPWFFLQAMYKNTAFPVSKMLRYLQHMEEFLHGTWVLVGVGVRSVIHK